MAASLTQEHVNRFREDGVVCLRGLFDASQIALIEQGIKQNIENPSPYGKQKLDENTGFFDDYDNWRRIEPYQRFVRHSPAAEMVAGLMESAAATFYHEHVLIKNRGCAAKTPWHHDQPYYPISGMQTCSLWIPLDPVSAETCVHYVQGSHRWGKMFMPRKFLDASDYAMEGGGAPLASVPDIDADPNTYKQLAWDLAVGDCIAFNMLTLHASSGNCSTHHRRALATRWFGDDVRFQPRPWEISPARSGGLSAGQAMACIDFPRIWPKQ